MPRKPSCQCDECPTCKRRIATREKYQSMTVEERRAWVGRRDQAKVRAADRARYVRDKPKRRAAMDRYAHEHPEAMARAKAAWDERNPEKRKAQWAVHNAIRDGRLTKGPCEKAGPDCSGRIEGHHDDYDKPLDVRWLCIRHHHERHGRAR